MTTTTTTQQQLLPVERDILMKERATLIDRLAFVERRLGVPSSVMPKHERERRKRERSPGS